MSKMLSDNKTDIIEKGFSIIPGVFEKEKLNTIPELIDQVDSSSFYGKGIYRPETINWASETEVTCSVPAGGIMIMRPLLLHASSRTINQGRRRVVHLEFCNRELPAPLRWAERISF